jgi:hypothetical protein
MASPPIREKERDDDVATTERSDVVVVAFVPRGRPATRVDERTSAEAESGFEA